MVNTCIRYGSLMGPFMLSSFLCFKIFVLPYDVYYWFPYVPPFVFLADVYHESKEVFEREAG